MYDPSDFEKDIDTAEFTEKLFLEKCPDAKIESMGNRNNVIIAPFSGQDDKELRSSNEQYQKIKADFLNRYDRDFLARYVAYWIKEVIGPGQSDLISLYEKPALMDYYEAERKIENNRNCFYLAVEIGKSKF